jgi:hypothetical protein
MDRPGLAGSPGLRPRDFPVGPGQAASTANSFVPHTSMAAGVTNITTVTTDFRGSFRSPAAVLVTARIRDGPLLTVPLGRRIVRRLDERDIYPAVYAPADGVGWTEGLDAEDLADVLRSVLHEGYADASDEEMNDALANVLDSISPAEAFNFASALDRIGKGASQLISDPTFAAVAQTALPILGGAAGTMIGGPIGTALGGSSQPGGERPAHPPDQPRHGSAGCRDRRRLRRWRPHRAWPPRGSSRRARVDPSNPVRHSTARRVPHRRWQVARPPRRRAWCSRSSPMC